MPIEEWLPENYDEIIYRAYEKYKENQKEKKDEKNRPVKVVSFEQFKKDRDADKQWTDKEVEFVPQIDYSS